MVVMLPSLHCHTGSQSNSWYVFNLLCFSLIIHSVILGLYLYLHWFPLGVAYVFVLHTGSPPCAAATEAFKILQPHATGKSNADFWSTSKYNLLKLWLLISQQHQNHSSSSDVFWQEREDRRAEVSGSLPLSQVHQPYMWTRVLHKTKRTHIYLHNPVKRS